MGIRLRLVLEVLGAPLGAHDGDEEVERDGTEVDPEELDRIQNADDANGETNLEERWHHGEHCVPHDGGKTL